MVSTTDKPWIGTTWELSSRFCSLLFLMTWPSARNECMPAIRRLYVVTLAVAKVAVELLKHSCVRTIMVTFGFEHVPVGSRNHHKKGIEY